MTKPKIIVAGYGSWAKAAENPAEAIATEMGRISWLNCEVSAQLVPVCTDNLTDHISGILDEYNPDAWIGIGVSSRALIEAEMIGINWCDFDVPDAAGTTLNNTPIVPNGPAAYNASLPNSQIVEAITRAGIPAAISFHAGTHLCNQMLYSTARLIEQKKLATLSGFIHVPLSPANILERGTPKQKPSMALSTMCNAMEVAIDATARFLLNSQIKTA